MRQKSSPSQTAEQHVREIRRATRITLRVKILNYAKLVADYLTRSEERRVGKECRL